MASNGIPARRSAVYLLDQVLGEGRLMSESLNAGALDRLAPEDRARAQRLALDTLRGLERADRILHPHLRKNPPLTVRNTLRLGCVELCAGAAAHGVINDLVQLTGQSRRHQHTKGLVNAILRKVADQGPNQWSALRVPRLPKWLRRPLAEAWGSDSVRDMEAAQFAGAPLDLTLRDPLQAAALAAQLSAEVLPTGSLRLATAPRVSGLPGYDAGEWWVQDAAAALPVQVLKPTKGEQILDLCAAPGGKTLQLAASGARVRAVDVSARRMARVSENLARTGLQADLVTGDALSETGQYDAVLLDAPCSATGTIRRHPDLPHAKDGSEFGELIAMQARMLAHAWTLVRPGGRLVYCTCSLLPDEGEVQVEEALANHTDMRADTGALLVPGVDADWITSEGGLRLRPDFWPDRGGMDGFYIACLVKAGG